MIQTILNGNFSIPFTGNTQDLFVIKKSNNYIGLSTVGVGGTSEGLYFKSNASNVSGINTHLYSLTTQFEQVTGDIDKVYKHFNNKRCCCEYNDSQIAEWRYSFN
ncbi:MAG: hypothetical protein CM15mP113_0730 [Pseudomonadota bacterium]|nr:MAG: hypothetical protein CM15mP113_0730 [Pseudomonadota bacterium]